jgi:hypothetical protein
MNEKHVVRKDEEQLEHLDKEIAEARQHLKQEQHEDERTFIDEEGKDTGENRGETDNTIIP